MASASPLVRHGNHVRRSIHVTISYPHGPPSLFFLVAATLSFPLFPTRRGHGRDWKRGRPLSKLLD